MTQALNVRQVAARLGIHPMTLRTWWKEGRFPAPFRAGRLLRWEVDVVDAWVAARRAEADSKAVGA